MGRTGGGTLVWSITILWRLAICAFVGAAATNEPAVAIPLVTVVVDDKEKRISARLSGSEGVVEAVVITLHFTTEIPILHTSDGTTVCSTDAAAGKAGWFYTNDDQRYTRALLYDPLELDVIPDGPLLFCETEGPVRRLPTCLAEASDQVGGIVDIDCSVVRSAVTPTITPTATATVTIAPTSTRLPNGRHCALGEHCASSFCVHDVCCENRCDMSGQFCAVPGISRAMSDICRHLNAHSFSNGNARWEYSNYFDVAHYHPHPHVIDSVGDANVAGDKHSNTGRMRRQLRWESSRECR